MALPRTSPVRLWQQFCLKLKHLEYEVATQIGVAQDHFAEGITFGSAKLCALSKAALEQVLRASVSSFGCDLW